LVAGFALFTGASVSGTVIVAITAFFLYVFNISQMSFRPEKIVPLRTTFGVEEPVFLCICRPCGTHSVDLPTQGSRPGL